ncbi:TetR family transcriptional regulator [Oxalicibacterium flavum]|uniref:TetR family transcriptional regulator n=2 Tax=Oxalicibacterium flavum TaxID=179467 RepID=A0A8J2XXK0_9BURK|nr:TetR family transcriptional regulator [Oxalicibacterium flavum]
MAADKKEALVGKAMELFAKGGYTAIGIDRILAEAGVAKMTLYKYFPSKTDLILEVLVRRDDYFRNSLMAAAERKKSTAAKIQALFTWHEEWFRRDDFNGCMFINAAAEFHERDSPIHQVAARHKQLIVDYIEGVLKDEYGARARKLARQINMLLDGAIDAAHVIGNPNAAAEAWEAAKSLLGRS